MDREGVRFSLLPEKGDGEITAGGVGDIEHDRVVRIDHLQNRVERREEAAGEELDRHRPRLPHRKAVAIDFGRAADLAVDHHRQRGEELRAIAVAILDKALVAREMKKPWWRGAVGIGDLEAMEAGEEIGREREPGGKLARAGAVVGAGLVAEEVGRLRDEDARRGAGDHERHTGIVGEDLDIGRPVVAAEDDIARLARPASGRKHVADLGRELAEGCERRQEKNRRDQPGHEAKGHPDARPPGGRKPIARARCRCHPLAPCAEGVTPPAHPRIPGRRGG